MNSDVSEYLEILGFSQRPYGSTPARQEIATKIIPTMRVVFATETVDQNAPAATALLNKMIQAMGLSTANSLVLASDDWSSAEAQIFERNPEVVVTLGTAPTHALLKCETAISSLRGHFHEAKRPGGHSLTVLPTYAPSFLLRNPALKKPVWEDLQKVMQRINNS